MNRRLGLMLAALLVLASCSSHHATPTSPAPSSDPAPAATTPEGAVTRFAWAWNHRDMAAYAALLTDDFTFTFQLDDSTGQPWREANWNVDDEWRSSLHWFVGGGAQPPALDVQFSFLAPYEVSPDPRPGRNPRWHRVVHPFLNLLVTSPVAGGDTLQYSIAGFASFYFVRGDSAAFRGVPAGASSDSTRWFLQRWEDGTYHQLGPARYPIPVPMVTWGYLKGRYWD